MCLWYFGKMFSMFPDSRGMLLFSLQTRHCFHMCDFPRYEGYWICCLKPAESVLDKYSGCMYVCVCVSESVAVLCLLALQSLCVRAAGRHCVIVCVCVRLCVLGEPGCRYHPSPCHRPKGCWESGRQFPSSNNEGCILISPTQNA